MNVPSPKGHGNLPDAFKRILNAGEIDQREGAQQMLGRYLVREQNQLFLCCRDRKRAICNRPYSGEEFGGGGGLFALRIAIMWFSAFSDLHRADGECPESRPIQKAVCRLRGIGRSIRRS